MKKLIATIVLGLLSFGAQAGLYYPDFIWNKHNVSVCFASVKIEIPHYSRKKFKTDAMNVSDARKLEAWVKEEFSQEITGLHFEGFRPCSEMPEADVVIFYTKSNLLWNFLFPEKYQLLGYVLHGDEEWMHIPEYPSKKYVWFNMSGFGKAIVIHEFGHVAGLAHEHMRMERMTDPHCANLNKDIGPYTPLDSNIVSHENYDSESIMNYCSYLNPKNKGLSKDDRSLLRFLYP